MARRVVIFLLLFMIPFSALADGTRYPSGTYAVVNNPDPDDCLNLREHPWPEAKSVGKYYNGTLVRLVAEYETSPEWVEVEIGHDRGSAFGFMMKRYLADASSTAVRSMQPARTAQTELRLLASPIGDAKLLALLAPGTPYTVLGYRQGYEHVQACGCLGYIASGSAK